MLLCAPSGVRPVNGLRAPTSSAAVTKISSPQTIGEEWPSPGSSIFHFTFFVSLHSRGGFPCSATPVPSGPRHWPHCFIGSNPWPSATPGNIDPIAAKRNAKDQGAMFRQKNIVIRRGCPVLDAFSTRLAKRISQASIDTANPYSFRT